MPGAQDECPGPRLTLGSFTGPGLLVGVGRCGDPAAHGCTRKVLTIDELRAAQETPVISIVTPSRAGVARGLYFEAPEPRAFIRAFIADVRHLSYAPEPGIP